MVFIISLFCHSFWTVLTLSQPFLWSWLLASISEEDQASILEVTEPSPENQVLQSSGSSHREPGWYFESLGITVNSQILKNLDALSSIVQFFW